MSTCHCKSAPSDVAPVVPPVGRSTVRSVSALALSFLVAFFPKCPMCWAAYCSALGLVSLSKIPYMGYLLPVLVAMLGLHLVLLFRQARNYGYGPFAISVIGAATLFLVRHYAPDANWALNTGILLIVTGSVWNSFAMRRRRLPTGQVRGLRVGQHS